MNLRSIGRRASLVVWWFISVGLFVSIWELTFALGLYSVKILPPPHVFLADLPDLIHHFDFSRHNPGEDCAGPILAVFQTIVATIKRVVAGFGLGFVLGVITGALIRYFQILGRLTVPIVTLLAPISPFAWLPVAVYMFGTGDKPAIFLVFIAVFFVIALATMAEIDAVQKTYLNVAGIMGASRLQTYVLVILPAVLPGLFITLRLNLFAAWMIVLIAESVGVGGGLGLVVIIARNTFDAQLAFFTMFIIGMVGFVLDMVLRNIQRRVLNWQS